MWPYWLMFSLVAWMAMSRERAQLIGVKQTNWGAPWWVCFWLLVMAIGLRHEVGGDWGIYLNNLNELVGVSFAEALAVIKGDPVYNVMSWAIVNSWGGIYLINTICALLFTLGLVVFCRAQPRPWLALTIAVPYLITVVAMGYTRQGAAIGLEMMALAALMRGGIFRFLLWTALAAAFHKSAVILVPVAVFFDSKYRLVVAIGVLVFAALLYVLLLQEAVDGLRTNYLEARYDSAGAWPRVLMNALPAVLYLRLKKHFVLTGPQRKFWTWMALVALVFVGLLVISPSSTAVDRVALYWIPLQLFVLSRLPDAFGKGARDWIYIVVAYSAAVLFVWLFFADMRYAWIPYKFYPFEALWM